MLMSRVGFNLGFVQNILLEKVIILFYDKDKKFLFVAQFLLPSSAMPKLDGLVLFSVNPATHPPPPPPGKGYFLTFLSEC